MNGKPKIYTTAKGKRYFLFGKKRIYVSKDFTVKEIQAYYKYLVKLAKKKPVKRQKRVPKTNANNNKNQAVAIINGNQQAQREDRFNPRQEEQINFLVNKVNRLESLGVHQRVQQAERIPNLEGEAIGPGIPDPNHDPLYFALPQQNYGLPPQGRRPQRYSAVAEERPKRSYQPTIAEPPIRVAVTRPRRSARPNVNIIDDENADYGEQPEDLGTPPAIQQRHEAQFADLPSDFRDLGPTSAEFAHLSSAPNLTTAGPAIPGKPFSGLSVADRITDFPQQRTRDRYNETIGKQLRDLAKDYKKEPRTYTPAVAGLRSLIDDAAQADEREDAGFDPIKAEEEVELSGVNPADLAQIAEFQRIHEFQRKYIDTSFPLWQDDPEFARGVVAKPGTFTRPLLLEEIKKIQAAGGQISIPRANSAVAYRKALLDYHKKLLNQPETSAAAAGTVGSGHCTCGSGNHDKGLYDDQIEKMMKMYQPEFHGVISRDEIKTLLPKIVPHSRLGFIINLDTSDKSGSHWCAVYIDARSNGSQSVEWFDSFGRVCPPDIAKDLKLIVDMLRPNTLLKFKHNSVVMQLDSTSNCGYFCIRFLIDRFRNVSFADSTGFNDTFKVYERERNEYEIERMKKLPKFNYI